MRKVVQLLSNIFPDEPDKIAYTALCDDGTIWQVIDSFNPVSREVEETDWVVIAGPPDTGGLTYYRKTGVDVQCYDNGQLIGDQED